MLPRAIQVVPPQVFHCKLLHVPMGEGEGAGRYQLRHRASALIQKKQCSLFGNQKGCETFTAGRLLWLYHTTLMAASPGQPKAQRLLLPPRPLPTAAVQSPCPRSRICGCVCRSPSGRQVRRLRRQAGALQSSQNGHCTGDREEKDLLQNEDLTFASLPVLRAEL